TGKKPKVGGSPPAACGYSPFRISYEVPSPPTAMKFLIPRPYASRAISVASPATRVSAIFTSRPPACRRSKAGLSSLRLRPPPAAGFTIARYFRPKVPNPWLDDQVFSAVIQLAANQLHGRSQPHHCALSCRLSDFLGQDLPLDLHGR